MDILTLKSKEKLGCNMCDKCCIYRGDIRLTPLNVCNISKFLKLSIQEFLEKYTDRLQGEEPELVLKTVSEKRKCILYNEDIKGCGIHKVKPMQCVMFPLVPENIKEDYFYNSNQCVLEDAKPITVNKWLNGNNKIYSKNKKICMEWISFIEWIQPRWNSIKKENKEKIYKILFLNYNLKSLNLKTKMRKNMREVEKLILNQDKEKVDMN